MKLTVTLVLFQPFAFAAGDAEAVIVGGVLAIFNVTFAVFESCAASVTVPVMT